MTIGELNQFLASRVPTALSCSWDNDGLLCCPDPSRSVRRALVALDVTEHVVDMAVQGGFDLLLTHH
ncbi:MAG: Nif3-like dinuclear metal center hexameric protein, partial [Clostridia bacterium]|nr:Nif3-like dinuclear metal center hexameric protein [Clostridia bacterium]